MKQKIFSQWVLILALSFFGIPVQAYDWPLSGAIVDTTFGTPENEYFLPGMRLSSHAEKIAAIGKGELKYYQQNGNPSSLMPTTLGTMMTLSHIEGMESIYACMGTISENTRKGMIEQGTIIGTTGSSGWAYERGMLFCVFDTRTASWVNPVLILPERIAGIAPVILSGCLTNRTGEIVLGSADRITQGLYTISGEIRDISGNKDSRRTNAPYEMILTVDGKEISRKFFDLLVWREGMRTLFGQEKTSRRDVLDKNGRFILADVFFPRGKTSIGITAVDSAGHLRKAEWQVIVR